MLAAIEQSASGFFADAVSVNVVAQVAVLAFINRLIYGLAWNPLAPLLEKE